MFTGANGYRMTSNDLDKFNRSLRQIFRVQHTIFKESKKKDSPVARDLLSTYRSQLQTLLGRTKTTYMYAETTKEEKLEFERELRNLVRVVNSACRSK